jgi:tetratricopeptide (TPR) repeat protein
MIYNRNRPNYSGNNSNDWGKLFLFGGLAIVSGSSIFWMLAIYFGIKMIIDNNNQRRWENPHTKRGPLEQRREAQIRKYEQETGTPISTPRTSPQSSASANQYKNSGIKKYKDFDLEEAIEDFKKGLTFAPSDISLHFNLACAYSLTEKKTEAYHHLQQAVAYGLKDFNKILQHDDLAYVRIQPEFDQFKRGGFTRNPFKQTEKESLDTSEDDANIDASLLSHLSHLAELRRQGVLSDEEFVLERKRILRQ